MTTIPLCTFSVTLSAGLSKGIFGRAATFTWVATPASNPTM